MPSHNDGLSSSDGEGSCSNLQTTIHPASLNIQQWSGSNPSLQTQFCGAAAAVDLWVESTTTDPVVRLQGEQTLILQSQCNVFACSYWWWVKCFSTTYWTGSDPGLPALLSHCVSEPVLSTTMDSEERGSPVNSCSCNRSVYPQGPWWWPTAALLLSSCFDKITQWTSLCVFSEAILALQSEVSRLKKDLEEGLVQLPHLAQKMDYLTSKYRHGRQERRSKTRARTHLRQSCNRWTWSWQWMKIKDSIRMYVLSFSGSQPGGKKYSFYYWTINFLLYCVITPSTPSPYSYSYTPSPTRIEDWISSDMDPSKSKGNPHHAKIKSMQNHSKFLSTSVSLHMCSQVQTAGTQQGPTSCCSSTIRLQGAEEAAVCALGLSFRTNFRRHYSPAEVRPSMIFHSKVHSASLCLEVSYTL